MAIPADMMIGLVVTAGFLLAALLILSRRQQRRKEDLLTRFSKLGTRNDLSFTGQEILCCHLLGFDGLKKKLLVLEKSPAGYRWYTVDLQEVRSCSVHKAYRLPTAGAAGSHSINHYVERVELQFHFWNHKRSRSIPFYCTGYNEVKDLPALETKARSWQCFLTKLLPAQKNGRA